MSEPTFFIYEPLPSHPDASPALCREMAERMRGHGATWLRMTLVSPEYPNPPYPEGFYLEGWEIAPHLMDPPEVEPPFNFPLTASLQPKDLPDDRTG